MRALHSMPWALGLCLSAVFGFLSRFDEIGQIGKLDARWSPAFERQVSRNVANLQVTATEQAAASREEKIILWNPLSASLTSGCAGSACVGSGCGLSGCVGSGCGLSGCAGSACAVSACGGSACTGSACGLSGCVGSACGLSGCVGSACTQSGCVGSLCIVSGCVGSGCVSSGCLGSYCVASICVESNCIGSVACASKCKKDQYALDLETQLDPVDQALYEETGGEGWWNAIIQQNQTTVE